MEFLDGVTLKHRIAGNPLETELILSLAIDYCRTPSMPPTPGNHHRDIKPSEHFHHHTLCTPDP